MKRSTFRRILILAICSVIGIGAIQLYWFREAFNSESDAFQREVTSALHNVANRFFELNEAAIPSNNPIRQLSPSYYVVMINQEIDANLLEYILSEELEKRDLLFDYEYGIYNCTTDEMVYGSYVSLSNESKPESSELPKWENQAYYFGVNFPQRTGTIINRMGVWIFSSGVLLLVIFFFSYSLFVILKQKRLSEIQKDFINTMTHEFKTPISTISISAGVLKDPAIVDQPERLLNYATIIDNENNRLKKQVERVLQIATMDDSDIQLKKEPVDLAEVIEEVSKGINTSYDNKASINVNIDDEIPMLLVDRLHVSNVLYNLLDNAIKYCSGDPLVQISASVIEGFVEIHVKDNGIGISRDHQKKVFEKFYRVPTGNVHNVSGFGLGLNYVALILEAHGGSISVDSTPGMGSTFIIKLPLNA